jgi:2',3'-cyclic-nucleotide 2'-phosphodiesterase (5'-nucleotidase family)
MSASSGRRAAAVLAAVAATAFAAQTAPGPTAAASPATPRGDGPWRTTQVQLLSFNDFHGNLEPPSGSSGRLTTGYTETRDATGAYVAIPTTVDAGGAEYLATHLAAARRGHRDTATVAAGDLIGASPLLSAAFHDEPTVEALNALRLDATAVGNHEFDEGYRELQRIDRGGCLRDGDGQNNQNSCAAGRYRGAAFPMLAANVRYTGRAKTILPPYWVKRFPSGAKIAFIGMTLEGTPSIVSQAGIKGLTFDDEATTANLLVPKLKREGVKAIVVLLHQGGTPATTTYTGANGAYPVVPPFDATCSTQTRDGVKGAELAGDSPVLDITRKLDPQIDMVISGHTHQPYVCSQPDSTGRPRLITSASAFGRLYTDTELTYNLTTGDIVRSSVRGTNMVVSRDVAKDPAQTAVIQRYQPLVAPIANRVIGKVSGGTLARPSATDVETPLGRLIADAQLADPSAVSGGQQNQIAFMNPGGIRADLVPSPAGDITYGSAFSVQPFSNTVVSMTMTGQQIYDLLEQQFSGANESAPKVLQVSKGFTYSYSASAAPGAKVVDGSAQLGGVAVDKSASYRVVANSFLAGGGDNFAAFAQSTGQYVGGLDIDGLATYLGANSPYSPVAEDRITQAP